MNIHERQVVGLIPAGGVGSRLGHLPFSKELYPICLHVADDERGPRLKVAAHYLLDNMRAAQIRRVYIVLRNGKWDIPAYFGSGAIANVDIAYLIARVPYGTPYTLDAAHPFVRDSMVAFGFPDIVFEGDSAVLRLLQHQAESGADVVLGLFPADQPASVDMVALDPGGRVRDLVFRPPQTDLPWCWALAVWTPVFTHFLHEHLKAHESAAGSSPELSVGHVVQAALGAGVLVHGVPVSDKPFCDIGTADGLERALRTWQHGSPILSKTAGSRR